MPKDTKSLGNNKAPACESRGFVHKKRGVHFDTPPFSRYHHRNYKSPLEPRIINIVYPKTSPIAPIISPTFSISFC